MSALEPDGLKWERAVIVTRPCRAEALQLGADLGRGLNRTNHRAPRQVIRDARICIAYTETAGARTETREMSAVLVSSSGSSNRAQWDSGTLIPESSSQSNWSDDVIRARLGLVSGRYFKIAAHMYLQSCREDRGVDHS